MLAESLIAEGHREMAGGDLVAAAGLLRRSVDLWRGPVLHEFAGRSFAAAEALRLEELREAALEDLIDAELALGRHHEVVSGLEGLVLIRLLRARAAQAGQNRLGDGGGTGTAGPGRCTPPHPKSAGPG